jgi:hypothetical protein
MKTTTTIGIAGEGEGEEEEKRRKGSQEVESSRHKLDSDRSISAIPESSPPPGLRPGIWTISGEREEGRGRRTREARGVRVRGEKGQRAVAVLVIDRFNSPWPG